MYEQNQDESSIGRDGRGRNDKNFMEDDKGKSS